MMRLKLKLAKILISVEKWVLDKFFAKGTSEYEDALTDIRKYERELDYLQRLYDRRKVK